MFARSSWVPDSFGTCAREALVPSPQAGAQQAHTHGLWESVREVPRWQLSRAPILCGVAVVENGFREPCAIEVVPPVYDAFLEADMRLLRIAKSHLAQVPFEHLDLLVV